MGKITTRSAEVADLLILYDFEQGIVSVERPYDPTLIPGHINYYDIKAMIESTDTEVVVALSGNEIVASGYVKIKQGATYHQHDRYGYVGFMFVREDHRGQGLSHLILDQLKLWSNEQGIKELRLGVYSDNARAIAAYEKYGFKKHTVTMRMGI